MVKSEETMMPMSQVIRMLEKALGVSGAYASEVPAELDGGDALSQEDMDKKKKKKHIPADVELNEPKEEEEGVKKSGGFYNRLRKLSKSEYAYNLDYMLGNLQTFIPKILQKSHLGLCKRET